MWWFYSSSFWIRGLLSNYREISKAHKLKSLFRNFFENKPYNCLFSRWLYTRFSRPRGTFISSAFQSGVIVKESLVFKGVGMAIVDTNVKTQAIKIPIPGMMII